MKSLLTLNRYFVKYKYRFLLGILFVSVSNIFAIIPARMVRSAIDLVLESVQKLKNTSLIDSEIIQAEFQKQLLIYGILIISFALLRGVFMFLTRQTIIVMSRYMEFDLKNEIYAHYQKLPISFYRKNNTGDLMSRISEDVSKVRMYLGPAIMYALNLFVTFAMVIGYMILTNPELTFYVLIPLPLLSISIYYVNTYTEKKSLQIQKSLSDLSTYAQEAFSGIRVLKAFAKEKISSNSFEKHSQEYRTRSLELTQVNSFFYPLNIALIGLSTLLTIYIGGLQVIEGKITPGNIAEFVIYVNMLSWPVTSLGWTLSLAKRAEASQSRINEFLAAKNDIISTKNILAEVKGEIRFDHISMVYPETGIKALDNISFSLPIGSSLAILGNTGSGKSTLAALFTRTYDPTEGKILVNNIDLKDWSIDHWRRKIGYVPQDVFLFSDTIRNNIAFADNNLSQAEIEKAAKMACVSENINGFEHKYETYIGERGITLSGGQKQRISIARAIAINPEILLLDDCLSAVDTHTESQILNNLAQIMESKTGIIISHRVSSARLASKIIFLDNGKIVEEGTHAELMQLNGMYKSLYEKQETEPEIVNL